MASLAPWFFLNNATSDGLFTQSGINNYLMDAVLEPDQNFIGFTGTNQARDTGDLDDDAASDIFFHDQATGQVLVWQVDGADGSIESMTNVTLPNGLGGIVPTTGPSGGWQLLETQGFDNNEDGEADLLWWNTQTGFVGSWDLNVLVDLSGDIAEVNYTIFGYGSGVPADVWTYQGVGDFDGDEAVGIEFGIKGDDILWTSDIGTIAFWEIEGGVHTRNIQFEDIIDPGEALRLNAGWTVAAVGDGDGDGDTDILLRDGSNDPTGSTTELWVWQNLGTQSGLGRQEVAQFDLGFIDASTQVLNWADYTGDFVDDFLLQQADGDLLILDPTIQVFGAGINLEDPLNGAIDAGNQPLDWYSEGHFGSLVG